MIRGRARRPRLLLAAAGAAVTAALGWGAARVAANTERCVHPPRTRLTEADRAAARTRLPHLEDVVFRTRDGLLLRGWFAPGARRSAVVLVHGLGANRAAMLPEAAILAARGHGVLLFDSRASGDSDGALATWGDRERLDLAAALDLLAARPDVDPSRLGAYGYSVGSSAVALAAAEDPRLHTGPRRTPSWARSSTGSAGSRRPSPASASGRSAST